MLYHDECLQSGVVYVNRRSIEYLLDFEHITVAQAKQLDKFLEDTFGDQINMTKIVLIFKYNMSGESMYPSKDQLHLMVDWECDPHVLTESGAEKVAAARELFKDVKHQSIDLSPECPELQEVLDHLSAALFWLNAGIARTCTDEPRPLAPVIIHRIADVGQNEPTVSVGSLAKTNLTMPVDSSGIEQLTATLPDMNSGEPCKVIYNPSLNNSSDINRPTLPGDILKNLLNLLENSKNKDVAVSEKNKEISEILNKYALRYGMNRNDSFFKELEKEYFIQ